MYRKVDDRILGLLEGIVEGQVVRDEDLLEPYSHDECALREIWRLPEVVVKPTSDRQVLDVLELAYKEHIPVTARGSGTGLCGGCVPIYGGIVLSLENMNRVLDVDADNLIAVVEPGVTLMQFAPEAQKEGLFFSPRPGDESASFGGIVATNAGGSRALGYGTTRDCTLALEVALPPPYGGIVHLGGRTVKNSSGYSLLHLMVGSEGTLGIVTKQVMRLDPLPVVTNTLIVPYESLHDAIGTVPDILKKGFRPTALEFVQQDVITVAERKREKKSRFSGGQAYLMIEIDATTEEELERIAEGIAGVCEEHNCVDVFLAAGREQEEVWDFRGKLYEAIKEYTLEILDIVVPPAEIANHVDAVQRISEQYGVWIPTYGHAGDGNVHSHVMKVRFKDGDLEWMEEEEWRRVYTPVRDALHEDALKRGGLVSGEHGIGLVKKKYLPMFSDKIRIELMKKVKREFDPRNILNPGKIFDLE